MSAGFVNIVSLVGLAAAGLVAYCARERGGVRYMAALCVALASSIVLTASSVVMLVDWPAQMQHFDFSAFRYVDRGYGRGPIAVIYFWPYYSAVAGVVAAYFCGRRIYDHVRA